MPERWNARAGRDSGTTEAARSLNAYFDCLQARVHEAHRALLEGYEPVTAQSLKNKLIGRAEKPRLLIETFEEHNRKIEALVGHEYSPLTLQRCQTSLKHLQSFLRWKFKADDFNITRIDHSFITEYEFYLRSVKKCGNNTAVKYIKNFGKIVRICLANGWIVTNPFLHYKCRFKKVDRIFLTADELEVLAAKRFSTDRLNQVKDAFLFCCYTGLAYVDVKTLRRQDIVKGFDGEQWIYTKRQKTGTPSRIPLLPPALSIIARYQDHPQCVNEGRVLPVLTNQKMNAYLKEMPTSYRCGDHLNQLRILKQEGFIA